MIGLLIILHIASQNRCSALLIHTHEERVMKSVTRQSKEIDADRQAGMPLAVPVMQYCPYSSGEVYSVHSYITGDGSVSPDGCG